MTIAKDKQGIGIAAPDKVRVNHQRIMQRPREKRILAKRVDRLVNRIRLAPAKGQQRDYTKPGPGQHMKACVQIVAFRARGLVFVWQTV